MFAFTEQLKIHAYILFYFNQYFPHIG